MFAWNTIASSLQTIYLFQFHNVWQCHKAEQLKRWEVRSHISPPSWNGLWDCRASRKPLMLYFTKQKWAQHCHCVTRQSCLSSVIALGSHWAERAVLLVTSVHTPQALRATLPCTQKGSKSGPFWMFLLQIIPVVENYRLILLLSSFGLCWNVENYLEQDLVFAPLWASFSES